MYTFEHKFNEDQPRDNSGRFASTGGGGTQATTHGTGSTLGAQARAAGRTLARVVGATGTAVLAATVLAAALKPKLNPSLFKTINDKHGAVAKAFLEKGLGNHQLSDIEKKIVEHWTSSMGSDTIQTNLRKGVKLDDAHVTILDNAISKSRLPESVKLFRGESLDNPRIDELKRMKPGDIIVDPGFTSTSLNKRVAESFAGMRGPLFHIHADAGKNALSIDGLSKEPLEHEVVLPRNSAFKLVKRNGRHYHVDLI